MSARAASGQGNRRLAIALISVVGGMIGLAYASVPLYDLFCRVTGYGGTTKVADAAPTEVADFELTVRFNADTQSALPWGFQPVQRSMTVRAGESSLAFYRAENFGETPVVGTATFNVTPQIAGALFQQSRLFLLRGTISAGWRDRRLASFVFRRSGDRG